MIIRRMHEVEQRALDMDGVRGVRMRLLVGRGDGAPTFSMREFTVEPGGHTPHHAHNYEHEVLILEGTGEADSEGGPRPIAAGDVLFVPANERHQFRNTGSGDLRFVCLVPAHFDCGEGGWRPTPGS